MDQAEKTSGDVENGAANEEEGKVNNKDTDEDLQANGTQMQNNNNNNNSNGESKLTNDMMERMNSSMILALDIDNDSLVSLAEFLRQASNFFKRERCCIYYTYKLKIH